MRRLGPQALMSRKAAGDGPMRMRSSCGWTRGRPPSVAAIALAADATSCTNCGRLRTVPTSRLTGVGMWLDDIWIWTRLVWSSVTTT